MSKQLIFDLERIAMRPESGVTPTATFDAIVRRLAPLGFVPRPTKSALYLTYGLDKHRRLNLAFHVFGGTDFAIDSFADVHDSRQIDLFKKLCGWRRPENDVFAYPVWDGVISFTARSRSRWRGHGCRPRKKADIALMTDDLERLVRRHIMPWAKTVTLESLLETGPVRRLLIDADSSGVPGDRRLYLLDIAGLIALGRRKQALKWLSDNPRIISQGHSWQAYLGQRVTDDAFKSFVEGARRFFPSESGHAPYSVGETHPNNRKVEQLLDVEAVLDAFAPILAKNGFAVERRRNEIVGERFYRGHVRATVHLFVPLKPRRSEGVFVSSLMHIWDERQRELYGQLRRADVDRITPNACRLAWLQKAMRVEATPEWDGEAMVKGPADLTCRAHAFESALRNDMLPFFASWSLEAALQPGSLERTLIEHQAMNKPSLPIPAIMLDICGLIVLGEQRRATAMLDRLGNVLIQEIVNNLFKPHHDRLMHPREEDVTAFMERTRARLVRAIKNN
jgi:hypothetical protein